jgi:hypothetical protein
MKLDQPLLARLKDFFGFFNLTEFEGRLLDFLLDHVEGEFKEVLQDQIRRFNYVNRVLESRDPRLDYGFTDFYYKRWQTVLKFTRLLPGLENVEEHILMKCKAIDEKGNEIACTVIAVRGALFEIQYRSPQRIWYPQGAYTLATSS